MDHRIADRVGWVERSEPHQISTVFRGGARCARPTLRLLLSVLLLCPALGADVPSDPGADAAARGQCFVLIVTGHPGNGLYARHYRDRTTRLHKYLTGQARVTAANITVLSGPDKTGTGSEPSPFSSAEKGRREVPVPVLSGPRGDSGSKDAIVTAPATAERILATLADLGKKVKPDDQFIFVLLGHGATSEESCTLMLPGRDIEFAAVAQSLDRIAARNQVVLNFASNSGDTLALLGHAGRVVVTASSPGQVNDNDFAEFFLQALENGAGDSGDESKATAKGRPSDLLATYNWAVLHTAQWTVRQRLSTDPETPGWTVEGKQSAEVFQKLYSGPEVSADRRFVPSPASEQPDGPIDLVCTHDDSWAGRRLITEHPALDDRGGGNKAAAKGVSALGDKGYQPLRATTPTEPGFLARQITLGDPRLLSVERGKERK